MTVCPVCEEAVVRPVRYRPDERFPLREYCEECFYSWMEEHD